MGTISVEELKRLSDQLRKQPVQVVPTDDDAREKRAKELIDNMRWEGLKDRLDDIRDLMCVNNLSLGALINLMLTMGTPMDADDRRSVLKDDAKSAKEILDKMAIRNDKTQKHLDNLMAELNALMGED